MKWQPDVAMVQKKPLHLYLNLALIQRCEALNIVMMKLMRSTFLLKVRMKVIVIKCLMKAIVVEVLIKTKAIKMIMMKTVTLRN